MKNTAANPDGGQAKPGSNEAIVLDIQQNGDPGGEKALRLYRQNHGLICKAINQYPAQIREDLEQECYFATVEAAAHYDPETGRTFASYLTLWLRSYCGRYAARASPVSMPARQQAAVRKYRQLVSDYRKAHGGKEPDDEHVMAALLVSRIQLEQIRAAAVMLAPVSLDTPVEGPGGDSYTLGDLLPDEGADVEGAATSAAFDQERRRAVWGAVATLKPDDAAAIRARYQGGGMTFVKIAEAEGTRPHHIKARVKRGLNELRRKHFKDLYSFYTPDPFTYSTAITGTGIGNYSRTGTSATERTALLELQREAERRFNWLRSVRDDLEAVKAWLRRGEAQGAEPQAEPELENSSDSKRD